MFLDTNDYFECCGCGACADICPRKAISMTVNHNGFVYPFINETLCIGCNKCRNICAFSKNDTFQASVSLCYYGWIDSKSERLLSTSGGAFMSIARAFFHSFPNSKHIVYGAKWIDSKTVGHVGIENENDLPQLRRSKYIKSETINIYKEINHKLSNGYVVLFSGTPCQVEQVKRYVDKNRQDHLLTVSLICNGVSSPLVFSDYVLALEKKYGSKVISYSFRNKNIKKRSQKYVEIIFANGKRLYTETDIFYIAFQKRKLHMEACFGCKYSNRRHSSDITIGDFWHIEEKYTELVEERKYGISLVLANTIAGNKLINEINDMDLNEVDYTIISPGETLNINMKDSQMDMFYKHYNKNSVLQQLYNYIGRKEILSRKYIKIYRKYLKFKSFIIKADVHE